MNVLITGTSSGLGYELAKQYLENGHTVYGISRSKTDLNIKQVQCDFNDTQHLAIALNELIDTKQIDIVILNAGTLGSISKTNYLRLDEFYDVFTVNVLSNKIIIDWLINHEVEMKHVVGISSGAALKSYYGWSLYCSSKAAFKQLISGYAIEHPDIRFLSIAPGVIKTKMQDKIYSINEEDVPSVKKFKDMYDTMDTPDIVAKKLIEHLPTLIGDSNNYCDLRDIK